ncbi:OmpA family protein [Neptuniibacter sp. QD37_11]|uniref:OmpA family protein n=1 Tax=Neptuniibacter sp. QD37_11 TaxID=3398209 RepID=UPI0039F533CD
MKNIIPSTLIAITLAGCGTFESTHPISGESQTDPSVTYAIAGGAAGAAVGAVASGDSAKGAVIGGIIGASAGYSISQNQLDNMRNDVLALSRQGIAHNLGSSWPYMIISYTPNEDYFSDTTPLSMAQVTAVAAVLSHVDNSHDIKITSFSGNLKSASRNSVESKVVSQSLADALIEKGVKSSSISILKGGEKSPLCHNSTPQGRSCNYRIVIQITAPKPQPFKDPAIWNTENS